MLPGENVPPTNPNHILELSNNGSATSSCPPKKATSQKNPKAKPTVVLTSDESESDETDTVANNDNIEKSSETPEEELGEFSSILIA